jgi:hypothetical protein
MWIKCWAGVGIFEPQLDVRSLLSLICLRLRAERIETAEARRRAEFGKKENVVNLMERNLFVNGNRRVIISYYNFFFGDLDCRVFVQNEIIDRLHEGNAPKEYKIL